jgi:hypothetical protein
MVHPRKEYPSAETAAWMDRSGTINFFLAASAVRRACFWLCLAPPQRARPRTLTTWSAASRRDNCGIDHPDPAEAMAKMSARRGYYNNMAAYTGRWEVEMCDAPCAQPGVYVPSRRASLCSSPPTTAAVRTLACRVLRAAGCRVAEVAPFRRGGGVGALLVWSALAPGPPLSSLRLQTDGWTLCALLRTRVDAGVPLPLSAIPPSRSRCSCLLSFVPQSLHLQSAHSSAFTALTHSPLHSHSHSLSPTAAATAPGALPASPSTFGHAFSATTSRSIAAAAAFTPAPAAATAPPTVRSCCCAARRTAASRRA